MKNYPTYNLNRKCLNCRDPIADQTHALRKFCCREQLDDGTILCCKDDYNSAKRKEDKKPFKYFSMHQETMYKQLKLLYEKHGENVTHNHLTQFHIIVNRPAEFIITENKIYTYYFVGYALKTEDHINFKIFKHVRIY